jgi:hypothetical protein
VHGISCFNTVLSLSFELGQLLFLMSPGDLKDNEGSMWVKIPCVRKTDEQRRP